MCIIIYKDYGVSLPDDKVLKTCLETHKNGFGAMWRVGNKVRIIKGLFDLPTIKKVLSHIPVESEAAFHFRLATHGNVSAGNCHPFPLTSRNDALTKIVGDFDSALMHNGIIYNFGGKNDSLSDTMNFVKHVERTTKRRYNFERMKPLFKGSYGKFVVFLPEVTQFFGDFVEEKKLKYSNTTYRDFNTVWGCNHKNKGFNKQDDYPYSREKRYLNDPIVKEVCNPDRIHWIDQGQAEYLGCYGQIFQYRGTYIFAEWGYLKSELDCVKEDIDYSIIEGEYEGGKFLTP